jgi:hypothetical protein
MKTPPKKFGSFERGRETKKTKINKDAPSGSQFSDFDPR